MSEEHFVERVVRAENLYAETSVGWEVVERFDHDEIITFQETVPQQSGTYGTNSYAQQKIGRVSSFRVRRAVNSPIEALHQQVCQLQTDVWREVERAKKAEKQLADTKALLNEERQQTERLRKERKQIEEIKRQLETDLGKVREYLGRKAFEEILPPRPATEGQ